MTEFAYSPEELTIPAGTYTLRITNDGLAPHQFALSSEGTHEGHFVDTGDLGAGETVEIEVDLEPGRFEYACHIPGHYESGMVGGLTVTS